MVFVASLLLSFCLVFLAANHALVARLVHAASLAHHERMSRPPPGEAVFYLWHDAPERLPALVERVPGVLGVDEVGPGGLIAMTFASADDPAVSALREDPGTSLMVNRDTALFCR